MRIIIDDAKFVAALWRLGTNILLVVVIAALPALHAAPVEILWVAGLCLAVALGETITHFVIAVLKTRKASFSSPSAAPRSRRVRLR